jgi:N-acyl-D-amino-acid deacylase
MRFQIVLYLTIPILVGAQSAQRFDVIIRNGTLYDGTGKPGTITDVGIINDTIAFIGNSESAIAEKIVDATGLAVAPGFINMLSWADRSLLMDGRSMSDIKQGVTLEVFGEGLSPGPVRRLNRKPVDSLWTTLGGYFKYLSKKGMSPNVASFVGATTVRMHELDQVNRPPNSQEIERMKKLVRQAMEEGALGLGSSLIYAPANYATTNELIELCKVVSQYGGLYITHMRSEADQILEALDETIRISKQAKVPAEIYHLKINIERNWKKIDQLLSRIDSAQRAGVPLTANMYPYTASATGLNARLPVWVLEGGAKEMRKRLKILAVRKKVLNEMAKGIPYKNSDPEHVVITGFRLDSLNRLYKGKRLSDIAKLHGKNADETTLDLIIKDKSRIEAVFYLQSEDIVRKIVQLPFVSFGSDAGSYATTPMFKDWGAHPRAFGTFARVLGKYVREEKLITLSEAIRRMTWLPAQNLKIQKRGKIEKGYYADVVIFDPNKICDRATFEEPMQYSEGMIHVFVNGIQVLKDGEHTGLKPGRIVYGPGYKKNKIVRI